MTPNEPKQENATDPDNPYQQPPDQNAPGQEPVEEPKPEETGENKDAEGK